MWSVIRTFVAALFVSIRTSQKFKSVTLGTFLRPRRIGYPNDKQASVGLIAEF